MSLVSNFIGGISTSQFGGNQVSPAIDMNDTTFAELLKKQMDTKLETQNFVLPASMGMPAGINIENFDGSDFIREIDVQNTDNTASNNLTSSETVTFFDSLLNNLQDSNDNQIMDFAKRHATNLYHQYSRSIVTDVNEFVEDIRK